jgi:integrase
MTKLTPQSIQAWINERKAAGRPAEGKGSKGGRTKAGKLSGTTMARAHAVLRRGLKQAVRWQMITTNPAISQHVDAPRQRRKESVYLGAEDAKKFLTEARAHRLEALFAVMLTMGLRPGEAYGAIWWDPEKPDRGGIDLEAGVMRVCTALEIVEEESDEEDEDGKKKIVRLPRLDVPKTERSKRTLPIPPPTLAALKRRSAAQKAEKMKHRDVWYEPIPGLVFETSTGSPMDEAHVRRALHAIAGKAKVKKVHPYALRHSAASLLLLLGVSMREVMEQLGHSTITLTANTYSHVAPELMVNAAAKMGALFEEK